MEDTPDLCLWPGTGGDADVGDGPDCLQPGIGIGLSGDARVNKPTL